VDKYAAGADLIFVDPPYADENMGRAFVARLARVGRSGTVVVWEQEVDHESQPNGDVWEILRDKTYGRARFLILRKL
jgi:16S rRNA G966 N2-methylase RsmD